MAGERPYFKHGIANLESIFESSRSNAAICKSLVEELKQRKTARAEYSHKSCHLVASEGCRLVASQHCH